jgi:hypothetical protein
MECPGWRRSIVEGERLGIKAPRKVIAAELAMIAWVSLGPVCPLKPDAFPVLRGGAFPASAGRL